MPRPALLVVLLLAACGVTQEDFPEAYAAAVCAKSDECDTLGGMSIEDCEDAMATFAETVMLDGDCAYDPDAGKACIEETESSACDAPSDDGDSACDTICGDKSSG